MFLGDEEGLAGWVLEWCSEEGLDSEHRDWWSKRKQEELRTTVLARCEVTALC